MPMRLKRKAFNRCMLPVMASGCETWSLSNTQLKELVTTQTKMERIMVGVTLKDRKSTNWIRKQSGVTDIIRNIRESKHRWTRHVAKRHENRWTISHRIGYPVDIKDLEADQEQYGAMTSLIPYVKPNWSYVVKDKKLRKACREGFLLKERD